MEFSLFKRAVQQQINSMIGKEWYFTNVDRDELWEMYLNSFPEGTNQIFRERREYDCSCCRSFVKNFGNVVTVNNGKLVSIWDIGEELTGENIAFKTVAECMRAFVKSHPIENIFRTHDKHIGVDKNVEVTENMETLTWEHFYTVIPQQYRLPKDQTIGNFHGDKRANMDVLKRGLTELSTEAMDIVLELIAQNSIYRGAEFKNSVSNFRTLKQEYVATDMSLDIFFWEKAGLLGQASRFKNSLIGTLLEDISIGVELEKAVKSFELKVAPQNYKRTSALITGSMIKKAEEKVAELGISESLQRRYAVTEDITVNNVLFADRDARKAMSGSLFDTLKDDIADKAPNLDKIQEISAEKFISEVIPTAKSVELMMENSHQSNLMSLIAPENADAKNILKWGNNFSWSYNGEVTDSMKELVRQHGGKTDGVLRFSIKWNDSQPSQDDLDAHCGEPSGTYIDFGAKGHRFPSSGMLDVDIMNPGNEPAVENIIYTDASEMPEGVYEFMIHQYHNRGGKGWEAEIEFDGKIFSFGSKKGIPHDKKITVGRVHYSKADGFSLEGDHKYNTTTKEIWGVNTNKWNKVSMIMNSPNHWDGEETGNKHLFFILEGCKNPDKSRGLYNEFLMNDLIEHRKVFEVLGSKIKAPESDRQLSGLGFSCTQKNSVLCKVTGNTNRVLKITF